MQRLSRVTAWDSRFKCGPRSWLRFSKCTFCISVMAKWKRSKRFGFTCRNSVLFGPIPQSTWRRRKNPDFLWAGNRWRRGQRDLGLGSALTMLTTLVQKSFCQKTIHGPRRLGSQTQMQMWAQLHTHTQIQIQLPRSFVLIWQHCPHIPMYIQPGERAAIALPERSQIRRNNRTSNNNNNNSSSVKKLGYTQDLTWERPAIDANLKCPAQLSELRCCRIIPALVFFALVFAIGHFGGRGKSGHCCSSTFLCWKTRLCSWKGYLWRLLNPTYTLLS